MSMRRVISCDVGRGYLLWLVCSLGTILLACALLHSVLQGESSMLLQLFLDKLGCVSTRSLCWCPTLCDPMCCHLPGSSVHGILQARILDGLPCPPPGDLPDPHSATCEATQIRGVICIFIFNPQLCTSKGLLVLEGSFLYWNVAVMNCEWHQDSWLLERRNLFRGQWWGLIAQSFLYKKVL